MRLKPNCALFVDTYASPLRAQPGRQNAGVTPHLDPQWTDGYQAIAAEILQALPGCRSLVFPLGGGGLLMGLTEYLLQHLAPVKLFGTGRLGDLPADFSCRHAGKSYNEGRHFSAIRRLTVPSATKTSSSPWSRMSGRCQ